MRGRFSELEEEEGEFNWRSGVDVGLSSGLCVVNLNFLGSGRWKRSPQQNFLI